MTTLTMTVTEVLRYRGKIGQWSWVLHRLAGLGTLLFLVLHVIDTSWVAFFPELYEEAIAIYQTPLFTIGEFALVACVVFHAFNGLRIAIFDFRPEWWRHQARAAQIVFLATIVVLVPVFVLMAQHVVEFYTGRSFDLQLELVFSRVVVPFGGGMILALLAGVLLSGLFGAVSGRAGLAGPLLTRRSRLEQVLWGFMRVSGMLILPLAFGHLAIMHVIEGVFSINQGGTGLAASFVAARWAYLGWRIYDAALLALALVHGFNGLRIVFNDYAHHPTVRRGLTWAVVVGCAALIIIGALALISGVPGM
ncbi:MAG: succinate dehydrogenase, cytochrome b556 subunit [Anaerolineae bacterium]|nr:succinate dehydrogenase, cytochrome b556 subunit [Anaerolineae bacterium]